MSAITKRTLSISDRQALPKSHPRALFTPQEAALLENEELKRMAPRDALHKAFEKRWLGDASVILYGTGDVDGFIDYIAKTQRTGEKDWPGVRVKSESFFHATPATGAFGYNSHFDAQERLKHSESKE